MDVKQCRAKYKALAPALTERARRIWAATEARAAGRGGISGVARGTGIGVVCLTGVGSGGRTVGLPLADAATQIVLRNNAVVGSVNANKRHWYKAAQALARADRTWLTRLVSRRERPEDFAHALERRPEDIKVVVEFASASKRMLPADARRPDAW